MTRSLLSCVGRRDPYDARAPEYFGALLACAKKVKAERAILIATRGTERRAYQTDELLQQILPACDVEIIESGIENPSDFTEVDRVLRALLKRRLRDEKNLFVNLSSGTPQMTACLSALIATGFLKAMGLKVSNPLVSTFFQDCGVLDLTVPTESQRSVDDRTTQLHTRSFPLVEHVTRANALQLSLRYDYAGALQLLRESERSEAYERVLLPLLRVAESLFVLKVNESVQAYRKIHNTLSRDYSEITGRLDRALSLKPSTILYFATELKYQVGRVDDFIRCAGLTREVRLNEIVAQENVKKLYAGAEVKEHSDGAEAEPHGRGSIRSQGLRLDRARLEVVNRKLLKFLEEPLKCAEKDKDYDTSTQPNREQRLSGQPLGAFLLLRLLEFASETDPGLKNVYRVLKSTEKLAGMRNAFAHNIQSPEAKQVKECAVQFKKLKKALEPADQATIRDLNPFLLINEILGELLRYWQDEDPVREVE